MSALNDSIRRSYDAFPYISSAFPNSAPEHLRAVAHVFGIDSVAPARARVLELGCAAGGNLLPFAARWPQAEVVAVDLSSVQIEAGRAAASAMGLNNIRWLTAELSEIGAALGQFDYIVAHGVYSWVPAEVRAALLRLCRAHLSPRGLAYVSYNVYPGWKSRELVRDAMLLDNHDRADPIAQLERGRQMLAFLHRSSRPDSGLRKLLDEPLNTVWHARAHYLAHDYMEICNAPCYFSDFVAACRAQGLDYLAEAEISAMFPANYGLDPDEPALRARAGDPLAVEQLLDFVTHRSFRQSLLCHAERSEALRYRLRRDRLRELHLAGRFAEDPAKPQHWRTGEGGWVQTRDALDRQLLSTLEQAWPASVPMAFLLEQASSSADHPLAAEQALLAFVEELISTHALRYRLEPVLAGKAHPQRPRAPKALRELVRWRAQQPVAPGLFNAWHDAITSLSPLEQQLLLWLDGEHDLAQLRQQLAATIGESTPSLEQLLRQLQQRALLEASDEHSTAGLGQHAADSSRHGG